MDITAAWQVTKDSDPTQCKYYISENGQIAASGPDQSPGTHQFTGEETQVGQTTSDGSGIPATYAGTYSIQYDLKITYRCHGTDGKDKFGHLTIKRSREKTLK